MLNLCEKIVENKNIAEKSYTKNNLNPALKNRINRYIHEFVRYDEAIKAEFDRNYPLLAIKIINRKISNF